MTYDRNMDIVIPTFAPEPEQRAMYLYPHEMAKFAGEFRKMGFSVIELGPILKEGSSLGTPRGIKDHT